MGFEKFKKPRRQKCSPWSPDYESEKILSEYPLAIPQFQPKSGYFFLLSSFFKNIHLVSHILGFKGKPIPIHQKSKKKNVLFTEKKAERDVPFTKKGKKDNPLTKKGKKRCSIYQEKQKNVFNFTEKCIKRCF